MTRDFPDGQITSEESFHDALVELLATAHENDIDILGGWPCRNGDSLPDWEVVVVELEKFPDT